MFNLYAFYHNLQKEKQYIQNYTKKKSITKIAYTYVITLKYNTNKQFGVTKIETITLYKYQRTGSITLQARNE